MAKVETIVFVSLLLDLLAFTIPLPLFPRIIQWYTKREISNPTGFLSRTLQFVTFVRGLFYKPQFHSERWDVVLLGGMMGSVFSTLQFLVSPYIGALSDKYGRRRILLITMIGNILSAVVWIQSTLFASYMLSRVIGGLSEGNVQLAIAILSDITPPENRSRALALVGIAFSICFIIGPPLGAYFASQPIPIQIQFWGWDLNIFAGPAFITLVLLVAETIFLIICLPETRNVSRPVAQADPGKAADVAVQARMLKSQEMNVEKRIASLNTLGRLHFLFLSIFSGVEFTLTFLTFDLFDWDNKKIGMLIGFIGVISAVLQGGFVRGAITRLGEGVIAQQGVFTCGFGLVFLAVLPHFVSHNMISRFLLYGAAIFMAFTSATVVNALTAFASLQCDENIDKLTGKHVEEHPQLAKGQALGRFRSSGQLGRAIGPLLACASYWTFGPSVTYAFGAAAMFGLALTMNTIKSQKLD